MQFSILNSPSPYFSESGDLLTWFGRDPEYEDKPRHWEASGKADREPEKFHFVKGFHRGRELYGQHALRTPEATDKLKTLGLVRLAWSSEMHGGKTQTPDSTGLRVRDGRSRKTPRKQALPIV